MIADIGRRLLGQLTARSNVPVTAHRMGCHLVTTAALMPSDGVGGMMRFMPGFRRCVVRVRRHAFERRPGIGWRQHGGQHHSQQTAGEKGLQGMHGEQFNMAKRAKTASFCNRDYTATSVCRPYHSSPGATLTGCSAIAASTQSM